MTSKMRAAPSARMSRSRFRHRPGRPAEGRRRGDREDGRHRGVQNARNDLAADQPVIEVDVDREKAADTDSARPRSGRPSPPPSTASKPHHHPQWSERDITSPRPTRMRPGRDPRPRAARHRGADAECPGGCDRSGRREDRCPAEEAKRKAADESAEQLESAREARDDAADQLEEARKVLRDAENPPQLPAQVTWLPTRWSRLAKESSRQRRAEGANDAIDDLVDGQREQEQSQERTGACR